MQDINFIREYPEIMRDALTKRGMEISPVDKLLTLDTKRRAIIQDVEKLKAERNAVSKEIGRLKDKTERDEKISSMRAVGDQISMLDNQLKDILVDFKAILSTLPNIPSDKVPLGKDEDENVVIKTVGEKRKFKFTPKPHWELGPELGIINFEQGVRITGSRFYVLSGAGARLQRALIAWMLDLHIQQGYTEKYTPFIVKEETMFGAGELPKFKDNLYKDHEEDLYFVPTAEVPLTGIHLNEILSGDQLPLRYTAYTPCFRREKMSAGRDVRGIKRGHQFDKVEMYIYSKPEDSDKEFERMVADAEQVCELLGLTYRINQLCTGDLGEKAYITYDIEVWAPGCDEWLEVSSISNVTDFQARRSNIRYKPENSKRNRLVHTLNGSGLGLPRTFIGVLENFQQEDGSVIVPDVLKPWMGGIEIINPEKE